MAQLEGATAHWGSYSCGLGPYDRQTAHDHCIVSVVLDAGAAHSFSGIRLVFFYEENKDMGSLILEDRRNPWKYVDSLSDMPQDCRRRLSQRHNEVNQNKRHAKNISANTTSISSLPLCTIFFEIDCHGAHGVWNNIEFVWQSGPPSPLGRAPFRVAFDRTYPSSSSLFVSLASSHIILYPISFEFDDHQDFHHPSIHSVRVIPSTRSANCIPALPPNIVRLIAEFVADIGYTGWRASLLDLGLVQKSWLRPVQEAFFSSMGNAPLDTGRRGDIIKCARSLEQRPELAQVIRLLRQNDFFEPEEGETKTYEDAVITILRLATNMASIHMFCVPISDIVASGTLAKMTKLRELLLLPPTSDEDTMPTQRHVRIKDIQSELRCLRELDRLDLRSWGRQTGEHLDDGASMSEDDVDCVPHYQLSELGLYDGFLTGAELICFVSGRPSTLQAVTLMNLSGLTNKDVLHFLSMVSPSLAYLQIKPCDFPKSAENEEYAFEAVLPCMSNLDYAEVRGARGVTPLAIARKGPSERCSHSNAPSIFATICSEYPADDLRAAMEATHWKHIKLKLWENSGEGSSHSDLIGLEAELQTIARRRGIELDLNF